MGNRLNLLFKRLIVASVILLTGCYAVTSRPEGGYQVATEPTFEQRQDFYLWGLVGESHINTQQVCSGSAVTQLQSKVTPVDALLGLITLGIYAPESAKVWCGTAKY